MTSFNSGYASGVLSNKKVVENRIKNMYPQPECEKENGCIYENGLIDFVCIKHIEWKTSQEIINMVREIKYDS